MTVLRCFVLASLLLLLSAPADAEDSNPSEPTLLDVQRVSSAAPHSAFTDLIRYEGDFYLAFREGEGHVSPDGSMRVLRSADGKAWEPVAHLTHPEADLRDASLSITPDGQLMLLTAAALHEPDPHTHQPVAWYSDDGENWSDMHEVAEPNIWLWSLRWHPTQPFAIGFGYSVADDRFVRLYHTEDGRDFEPLVDDAEAPADYPNESAIVFLEDADDTALALLRQDPGPAMLGSATPPYTDWTWQHLDRQIGGPAMIQLPDGRLLAAVRLYDDQVRTALCWVDRDTLTLTEFITLPSGGDTSYPGLVFDADTRTLHVSYYSSHEDRTAIYLARVRIPQ